MGGAGLNRECAIRIARVAALNAASDFARY
jgi:hypothetical protein